MQQEHTISTILTKGTDGNILSMYNRINKTHQWTWCNGREYSRNVCVLLQCVACVQWNATHIFQDSANLNESVVEKKESTFSAFLKICRNDRIKNHRINALLNICDIFSGASILQYIFHHLTNTRLALVHHMCFLFVRNKILLSSANETYFLSQCITILMHMRIKVAIITFGKDHSWVQIQIIFGQWMFAKKYFTPN